MQNGFDFTTINKRYSYAETWRAVWRPHAQNGKAYTKFAAVLVALISLAGIGLSSVVVHALIWVIVAPSAPVENRLDTLWITVGIVSVAWVLGIWLFVSRKAIRRLRLQAFAQANNMTYLYGPPAKEEGLLFDRGHSQVLTDGLRTNDNSPLLMTNYKFTEGSGKNSHTYRYSVIKCSLSRALPHVLLDATSNNFMSMFSNMGDFAKNQRIELEGDFSRYFSVYCPEGYGPDMLYWLTPELMELLKQYMHEYDIEVVGKAVYAYRKEQLDFDEQSIQATFQLARWLQAEFEQNTRRYADTRVANAKTMNVVARHGQRLKRRTPWALIILVLIVLTLRFISALTH